jgi:hypothetical protein
MVMVRPRVWNAGAMSQQARVTSGARGSCSARRASKMRKAPAIAELMAAGRRTANSLSPKAPVEPPMSHATPGPLV